MISKSVCHFLIAWHAPYNVGLPHNATMGRDEILQQAPLKRPRSHQIRKTKFYAPL
ncbi:hypothetical protein KVD79_06575 [Helicobacter pylori]|nr:hypothetical protein KVD79_06575 [Helicobacter pylori]